MTARSRNGETVAEFAPKSDVLLDEARAGGRINLIIGRSLTAKAREAPGLARIDRVPPAPGAGFRIQGWLHAGAEDGRLCGGPPGRPGYPSRHVLRAEDDHRGSQDTTGPMTRDERRIWPAWVSADLVMQSFCHTAAYPKPVDVKTHRELPAFISSRAAWPCARATAIHSWLNRLHAAHTVGGGDLHTRFPSASLPRRPGPVAFRRCHRRDAAGHA